MRVPGDRRRTAAGSQMWTIVREDDVDLVQSVIQGRDCEGVIRSGRGCLRVSRRMRSGGREKLAKYMRWRTHFVSVTSVVPASWSITTTEG